MSEGSLRSKNTKSWKTVAVFLTYKEANDKRNTLINDHTSVKVKRGESSNKEVFRVKVWDPPKKKTKKEKNNRRTEKNVNKKIRS